LETFIWLHLPSLAFIDLHWNGSGKRVWRGFRPFLPLRRPGGLGRAGGDAISRLRISQVVLNHSF
jgi:hypothetical protein